MKITKEQQEQIAEIDRIIAAGAAALSKAAQGVPTAELESVLAQGCDPGADPQVNFDRMLANLLGYKK